MKNPKRMSVRDLVATYVGAIAKHPERTQEICREAAGVFIGMERQQQDVQARQRLHDVAMEFANAGSRYTRPATADDFHELLLETAEAYEEVGDDPIDLIARRREIFDERAPHGPSISIAPESFNRDATLGRSVTIKYNPSSAEIVNGIKQSETVLFWQGQKREACAISVSIAPLSPPIFSPLADLTSTRPYGSVEFGADGNKTQCLVDLSMGTRFTVPGNYLSVVVGMYAPMDGSVAGQMTVGASMGVFAAPSAAPVMYTAYIDNLGNNDSSDLIQRPMMAAQLLPLQTNASAGNTLIEFLSANGTVVLYTVTYPTGTIAASPVPLAGDVGYIKLTNQTGDTVNYRAIFQLAM